MTSRSLFGSLATALVLATPLASQQPIDGRLAGRVSPAVAAVVRELAPAAAARGLPIDPLIQKAIEGSAKGVPADIVAAVAIALLIRWIYKRFFSRQAQLNRAYKRMQLINKHDIFPITIFHCFNN